jgi:predicted TIM-barrel fold metal-dependent hydrolase
VTQPFTDAHVHFWDHSLPGMRWRFLEPDFEHPRLKGMHRLDAPRYGPQELLAEAGEEWPEKVVHIQCATLPAPTPTQETEWLESLADASGYPHALVAGCRLREPDAGAVLASNAAYPRFRGVRDLSITGAVAPGDVRGAFDAAADHAASVELMLPLEHYDSVARLAEHWPAVTIVLGHAGQPLERDSRYLGRWSAALGTLADAAPNVVLKLSAIASSADPTWTVDSVRPVVLRAIEAFGAERCMFASNWPIDRLFGTYSRLIRTYRQIASELSEREQAALLHGTANRVYAIT